MNRSVLRHPVFDLMGLRVSSLRRRRSSSASAVAFWMRLRATSLKDDPEARLESMVLVMALNCSVISW